MSSLSRISDLTRSAISLGAGTAVGHGLVILATPVWSRLYDSADFGRLGLFLSFLSTAIVGVTLRYDLAISLGKDRKEASLLLWLCILIMAPMSVLFGLILVMLCQFRLIGFGELPPWSGLLAIPFLGAAGLFTALRYWHVGIGEFSAISRSLVVQGAGRAIVPILLAPFHLGWIGLVAGDGIGRFLGIRRLSIDAVESFRWAIRQGRGQVLQIARAFRRFPTVFLPSAVLDAISSSIVLPVFILLYGVSAGGVFLLAQQIVLAPSALLCGALADVYQREMVSSARQQDDSLQSGVVRAARWLLIFAAAVFVPIGALAPLCATAIFGGNWGNLGTLVALLSPAAIVGVAASTLSRVLLVSRVPQVKLVADALKLVLPTGAMIAAQRMGYSETYAVAGYSATLMLTQVIYLVIIIRAVTPLRQVQNP